MKLWLLEQMENNEYDTYNACVVVAETETEAKMIHPESERGYQSSEELWADDDKLFSTWATKTGNVIATLIGEADASLVKGDVVCSSFNAG